MATGWLGFNCEKSGCEFEQKLGRVIFEFVKVSLSLYNNAGVQVSLEEFGFATDVIDQFKTMFVKFSSDNKRMKIHPCVANSRDGDEFVNIFAKTELA